MTAERLAHVPDLTEQGRGWFDGVTFLTIYLVLTYGIPSYLTIPALGSVGRPSVLWGLVGLAWWICFRIQRTRPVGGGVNLVRAAALTFFCIVILSYAVARLRGLPIEDVSTANSSLIRLASWAGVFLVAVDGIPDAARLMAMLRRVVIAGTLMAALGVVQFVTGLSLVDSISLPGFATSPEFANTIARGGFVRSAATASHPLEYGAVLCVTLPLAVWYGFAATRRTWIGNWLPAFVVLLAAAISMSRSALIGIALGLVLLAPSLPKRFRLKALVALGALGAGLLVLVPGMIGTIRGLFLSIGTDSSTSSRADSAVAAIEIALRSPIIGRGFGLFLPEELILDNQILLLLIGTGFLGLAAFGALIFTCIGTGWRVAARSSHEVITVLGAATSAGIAAGSSTFAFFDGLSFPISAGLLFLMFGVTGAIVRLQHRLGLPRL